MDVFVLHHTHNIEEDNEDVKLIGVYSTFEIACSARDRAKELAGFIESQAGFSIDRYILDEDNWTEGFSSK